MLGRERLQRAIRLTVELHEDIVPDLDDLRVVLVDQLDARHFRTLRVVTQVDMDFGARTARTRVAHLPEVIMFVTVDDTVFRQELRPDLSGLVVSLEVVLLASLEDRRVKAVRVDLQHIHEVFPCPGDRLLLEVITEGPVAQHLEHGVVVGIEAHLLQIVVLSAHTEAFLRIRDARVFTGRIAQKYVFELIHARIGEHQCRVVFHHHRCGRNDRVALRREEVGERFADFFCC